MKMQPARNIEITRNAAIRKKNLLPYYSFALMMLKSSRVEQVPLYLSSFRFNYITTILQHG